MADVFISYAHQDGDARARIADPAVHSRLVGATITAGMMALVPSALVFAFFRNAGRRK